MRPLNLNLSGFGPYAGRINIHMDDLGSQGLYLITGGTGSGKTTIFDAICFALYGEASGSDRDASMFRSKYADPETPTEVELTFLHRGKEYYVRRSPAYSRPKKRGNGVIDQDADAELRTPDGHVYTKVKDVTTAIERLMGINKDQFSRIAMLTQGDFTKFLFANTEQRREILRELFQTQLYQELQDRLKDELKKISGQAEVRKNNIKQYILGIQVDKDDILSIDVKKAQNGTMTTEDVVELLDKLIDQDNASKDRLDKELKRINYDLEVVNKKIGVAEEVKKAKEAKAKNEKELKSEIPKLKQLKLERDAAETKLETKTKCEKKATIIETKLPNYDKVDSLQKELEEIQNNNENNLEELKNKESERENKNGKLAELKKEQDSLKDTSAAIEKSNAELEKIEVKIKAIDDLEKSLNKFCADEQSYIELQKCYRDNDKKFKEKNDLYESMEQAFRDGQAGILAEKLKDGEKCPVCGSTSHPHPAVKSGEIPSEKELNVAKKESEEARKPRDKVAKEASGFKKLLEAQEKELCEKTRKIVKTEDLDEARDKLEDIRKECIKRRKTEEEKLVEELENEKRKKQLDEEIPKLEKELEELRASIEEISGSLSAGDAKEKEKSKQLAELKRGLEFESKADAEIEFNKLLKQAKDLQDTYDEAEKAFSSEKEIVCSLNAAIQENDKTIKDAKATDINEELEKQTELKKKREDYSEQKQSVNSRLENNKTTRTNIISKSEEIAKVEQKLQWITSLSKTANGADGKLSGGKITLETYVQMTYFDRIINRANLRLITMSNGQYELIRMQRAANAQSQSGLDLNVIDHYNGTERSVKTLSGGEAFMASLSLALGLSDEVQASAGGIQIDTMFVDEGFGSLDPEALDMAYKALAGLTEGNRLVGIISHIADLKERIDKQVVVTKEKSGGSHIKIVI